MNVFASAVDVEENERKDDHFDGENEVWECDSEVVECHVICWVEVVG